MVAYIGIESLLNQDIESLVTDHSGVLLDDREAFHKANMMILKKYDKPLMTIEEWLGKTQIDGAKFLQSQGINEGKDFLNNMNKKCYEEVVRSGVKPVIYPDVKETLEFLDRRGITMSILSTHPQDNLISETKDYEILGFFTLVVGSSKDKTKDLTEICKKIGKKKTLYVDDSRWGVLAANNAKALATENGNNILTAGITTGYHPRNMLEEVNPDGILEAFSDLKPIFS
jgi:phosphoglycolate phosphatase-like HAD superfamily hydrolase